jgi:hypothetical protein
MADKPKEAVYDSQIYPLMKQVIEICKREKIAILSSFALEEDEEGDFLMCTTAIFEPGNRPDQMERAYHVLMGERGPAMKLTVKDGDGKIVSQEVIIP